MSDPVVIAILAVVRFLIGGLWYSPLLFARPWMRGLGITQTDIDQSGISKSRALLASAAASLVQVLVLAWLLRLAAVTAPMLGALVGIAASAAFGLLPGIKDRVWVDRPWSVILIDHGYELVAAAICGAALAYWVVR